MLVHASGYTRLLRMQERETNSSNATRIFHVIHAVTNPTRGRSANMAAIRSKHTRPEMAVRSSLHRSGFRFRLHRSDLPGNPDIVLPRLRTVVFVHGCFWHGHRCRRAHLPKTNTAYWLPKIERNRARFRQTKRLLRKGGWDVKVIHECTLEKETRNLLYELSSTHRR